MLQILQPPLLCGNKVLVRLQLHLHISSLAAQLTDAPCVISRGLLLDLSIMLQLLLQLLILLNTGMILIILGEELPRRPPTSPLGAHEHIALGINSMIQHGTTKTKPTRLRIHNRSSLTLADLLTHLLYHLLHGLFGYLLLLNGLDAVDLHHAQWQWVMSLVVLSFDLFFDTTVGVIVDVVFLKISQDYVSLFGLLRVDRALA